MELKVLGSSSHGNCYILENETEALIIECGIRFKEVMESLDFQISKVVGCLLTHEHLDHSKYTGEYIRRGITVYSAFQTQHAVELITGERTKAIAPMKAIKVGNFTVTPFNVPHDGDIECYGYIIKHEEIGSLLFATDLSYIPYSFKKMKLNHIMIECNHIREIVDNSYIKSLRDRVISTHMSLDTCVEAIRENKSSCLMNVILLHLSDSNSNEKVMLSRVKEVCGNDVNVVIANKGVTVNLDLCPF